MLTVFVVEGVLGRRENYEDSIAWSPAEQDKQRQHCCQVLSEAADLWRS